MASKASVVGGVEEVECISVEVQPPQISTPPPLNTDEMEGVSANVEDDTDSSREKTFCGKPVKITCSGYIIYCLVFLLSYPFLLLATAIVMPVLLIANVVVRLLQFFVQIRNFQKQYYVNLRLRYLSVGMVILLLVELGIFYPIAKYVIRLKLVMVLGLSIKKWILLCYALIGIYLISQAVWFGIGVIIERMVTSSSVKGAFVLESVSEITNCLLFRWGVSVVMNWIPAFKHSKILDIYSNNWIEVFIFMLIGYNSITLLTCLVVWSLPGLLTRRLCNSIYEHTHLEYVAFGIHMSIIFILSVMMLLLTWVLYFQNRLNSTLWGKRVFKFGTRSLASALICSFLWLIKTSILLYWKAHVVYIKQRGKIPEVSETLYFFVLLRYAKYLGNNDNTCTPRDLYGCGLFKMMESPKTKELRAHLTTRYQYETDCGFSCFDREIIRETLLGDYGGTCWSMYELQEAAQVFLTAQHLLGSSNSLYLGHLLDQSDSGRYNQSANIFGTLKNIVQVNDKRRSTRSDWGGLLRFLSVADSTREITFQQVKTSMERSHSKCSSLANVLTGEEQASICLNNVLSVLVIGITLIIWLLMCELTTTSLLVLVATPLLAASFIFGDTCKTLFQGLMFVYVTHLFKVGDQCIIDEKQLEVKRIGVWNCIFVDVHARCKDQDIVYANSELANKKIIKCNEIDWNDNIEFNSSSLNQSKIPHMKADVERYISSVEFVPTFNSVDFHKMGDDGYKIAIKVRYKAVVEGDTNYFESLEVKERRRSELSTYIRNLLSDYEQQCQRQGIQRRQGTQRLQTL